MSNTEPDQHQSKVYPEHPDDIAADGGSRVVRNYYACQSHCCARHGCKYGYTGCPVTTGQVTQDHPCEQCTWEIDEAAMYGDAPWSKPGEVGYSVVFAAQRTEDADGGPMAGMPTDAQVAAKVAGALVGLDLGNGWTITRVTDTDTEG